MQHHSDNNTHMHHHSDNNSTADVSSLSSAFEHNNQSSDDFLKIDAGGIVGFFERLPMWLKLLAITLLASVIILAFAGWLAGVEGSITASMVKDRAFTEQFLVAANLARAIQKEREESILLLVQPTDAILRDLREAISDTDANWVAFTSGTWFDQHSPIALQMAPLSQIRSGVQRKQLDPLFIYQWYTDKTTTIMNLAAKKNRESQNQGILTIQFVFLSLRNAVGKLRSFGIAAFSITNSSMNASLLNTFAELMAERNTLVNTWMELGSQSQLDLFNQTVLMLPEYTTVLAMENDAIAGFRSTSRVTIDIDAWAGNTTAVRNACSAMLSALLNQADSYTYTQFVDSAIHIAIIGVLAFIFIVLYALVSFCFSKTIIGPWVRMNRLQETVTYKFVPRGLLRMIGCETIMQVQVGKHNTKQTILMNIAIRDYWKHMEGLSVENRILYTNRFFDVVNPLLSSYSGYIDTMKADEMQIYFKTPGSAVTCANKIHHLMVSMNMSDFAPLNITISIHAAPLADLAIVGDQDRIQGVLISKLQRESKLMLSIARRFQCKTIVSSNVIEMLGEKIDNPQLMAMIDGKSHFMIYEISSKLSKSERDQFSKAVRDVFVDHDLPEALSYFTTIDCAASKFYTKVCEQVLEQCKHHVADLTVEELLSEPMLEETVCHACEKEQSTENLEIFKTIQRFKEACIKADHNTQRECVVSITNRMEQANITDTLKRTLLDQLKDEGTWNENIFHSLEGEMMLLLTDTIKRLKMTDPFRKTYIKCKGLKSDLLTERFEEY